MIRRVEGRSFGFPDVSTEPGAQAEESSTPKTDWTEKTDIRPAQEDYKPKGPPRNAEHQLSGKMQEAYLRSHLEPERRRTRDVNNAVFKQGSIGTEVYKFQITLNHWLTQRGIKPIAEDGVFGPETERALKVFRGIHGLAADGIAGPQTKEALGYFDTHRDEYMDDKKRGQVKDALTSVYPHDPQLKRGPEIEHISNRRRKEED
jgi:murein L,D-transpeptidase YcbB/YkuD